MVLKCGGQEKVPSSLCVCVRMRVHAHTVSHSASAREVQFTEGESINTKKTAPLPTYKSYGFWLTTDSNLCISIMEPHVSPFLSQGCGWLSLSGGIPLEPMTAGKRRERLLSAWDDAILIVGWLEECQVSGRLVCPLLKLDLYLFLPGDQLPPLCPANGSHKGSLKLC